MLGFGFTVVLGEKLAHAIYDLKPLPWTVFSVLESFPTLNHLLFALLHAFYTYIYTGMGGHGGVYVPTYTCIR